MANQLDELNPQIREEGLDTNVIAKKIPVKVGVGSTIFEILLWVLGIFPGVIFLFMKIKAKNYFSQLEQKIQANASQIDNYLEQRVVVLQNCARLLDKAIDLDKTTYENIARYRSGSGDHDAVRNELVGDLDKLAGSVNVAFENYPELQAHEGIRDAMQQNMYLQRDFRLAHQDDRGRQAGLYHPHPLCRLSGDQAKSQGCVLLNNYTGRRSARCFLVKKQERGNTLLSFFIPAP